MWQLPAGGSFPQRFWPSDANSVRIATEGAPRAAGSRQTHQNPQEPRYQLGPDMRALFQPPEGVLRC